MAQQNQEVQSPEHRAAGPESSGTGKPSLWKRGPVIVAGSVLLAFLFFLGIHYLVQSLTHESTDNAFLDGDIVAVAPRVGGQVKTVRVRDNQSVKAGDLLMEIDPRDYEIEREQKQAAASSAQANVNLVKASFDLLEAQVETAQATARESEAEAGANRAKADWANVSLKRAEDLRQKNIISPQEYDSAKANAESANSTLKAGQEKAASDRSKVKSAQAQLEAGRQAFARSQAQSEEARVNVAQAEQNLSYTSVTAPKDGRITRKAVEPGDFVQPGQKLMALVLTDVWVTANFKETQLRKIRVGQPVMVSIDAVAGREFPAKVESIQSGSGAAFSLLPPENAVGNYVKVVQRVPVKIVFTEPLQLEHVVGPGMSVVPSVQVASFSLPAIVVALAALVLAAVAGFFWNQAAKR
jgi:membrane fusion protein (multidrug efflux system)